MAKRQISDDECYSEPSHKQSTRKRTKVPHSNGRAGTHAPGSHAASIHIIISPTSIQQALLDWFVDVRDSRGMPWRKQYDPTLGPDGRAQRAYEVGGHLWTP
jgi:A/G-specific adenine glycosylase